MAEDHPYAPIESRDELTLRVYDLQIQVEQLKKVFQQVKTRKKYGLGAGTLVILLLSGSLYFAIEQTNKTEQRINKSEQEVVQIKSGLEQQRQYIQSISKIFTEQKAQLAELKLSDTELFKRALTIDAEQTGISVVELEEDINLFVAAVRPNPGVEDMDHALANFSEKSFATAAKNAGEAGDKAHAKRLAAKEFASHVQDKENIAKVQEREARILQGQSHDAEKNYADAVFAYKQALDPEITPRSDYSEIWADLQVKLGLVLNELAAISTGANIALYKQQAIAAYQSALQVLTRETLPQDWAKTQNNLSNALRDVAEAEEDIKRIRLLTEAVIAKKAYLEIYTAEFYPKDYAEGMAWINEVEAEIEQLVMLFWFIKETPIWR